MILSFDCPQIPDEVVPWLSSLGLIVHNVQLGGKQFIATSGDQRNIPWDRVRALPGVTGLIENPALSYFASRSFRPHDTVVRIGGVEIGGGRAPVIIAGPCAVENYEDTLETAYAVKAAGAQIFRGSIFKPRTSPYNFQGIGRKGLEILADVRDRCGIPVISEVLDPDDIPAVAEVCDALWIGTRNMTNSALLKRLGRARKPVLIKRGFSSPIEEWVRAAEFVIVNGNPNVVLCERGIQTFEKYTRFTLDLAAIPAAKELTHLPIVVDPSHGTGRPTLIRPMACAAIAAGANGLMIESHSRPQNMIKPGDDFQALLPEQLAEIIAAVRNLHAHMTGVAAAPPRQAEFVE